MIIAPHTVLKGTELLGTVNTAVLCKNSLLSFDPLLAGSQHSDGLQYAAMREP